jgi:TetR/AcrR family transcriptional repressor of nem operon
MVRRKAAKDVRSTKQHILDVATEFMQERGFQGFSFLDVAKAVGVSHVAVHHHFATKSDLAVAAMAGYTARFEGALADIAAAGRSAADELRAFAALFEKTLEKSKRACLCGMLSAELTVLPREVQDEVRRFYEVSEAWLTTRIGAASPRAEDPEALAATFLATLEGALMSARALQNRGRLTDAAEWFIESLPSGAKKRRST